MILRSTFLLLTIMAWTGSCWAQSSVISTVAGIPAPLEGASATSRAILPAFTTADGRGGFYFSSSEPINLVYHVGSDGILTVAAGNGLAGNAGDGGPAISASLRAPYSLARSPAGDLYFADYGNNRIRKVSTSGIITTVADVMEPYGLAVDAAGNLYISTWSGSTIRKVSPDGAVTIMTLPDDLRIYSFASDSGGNLFFIKSGTQIVKRTPDGSFTVIADMGISFIENLTADIHGDIFFIAGAGHYIRRIDASTSSITTIAGSPLASSSGDGGPATSSSFTHAYSLSADDLGNLFVVDSSRIRRIGPNGIINTVAGVPEGSGARAALSSRLGPQWLAAMPSGEVLFTDAFQLIRKLSPGGSISTFALSEFDSFYGRAQSVRLRDPGDLTFDSAGRLFAIEADGNGFGRVVRVDETGLITTVAGGGYYRDPPDGIPALEVFLYLDSVAVDPEGNIFISSGSQPRSIFKVGPDQKLRRVAYRTSGMLATDAAGNLYIADYVDHVLRKLTPSGTLSVVAANLTGPGAVAIDASGNIYFTDGYWVRRISPSGALTTVAGTGQQGYSGDGGSALTATLFAPWDIVVDRSGNLFVTDYLNIRKITFSQASPFTLSGGGGRSSISDGSNTEVTTGYGVINPGSNSVTTAGLEIFGYRQNNVLVSEVGVSASTTLQNGRIPVEISNTVNTGLALVNPGDREVSIFFEFSDESGSSTSGSFTLEARTQTAKFLNQAPFNVPSPMRGTFTFSASAPLAAVALRGLVNERSEYLLTSLTVSDLNQSISSTTAVLPHFANGGGWSTRLTLLNPTDRTLSGTVEFRDPTGQLSSSTPYSLAARASIAIETDGAPSSIQTGSARIAPSGTTATPSGTAIFSYRDRGVTVTQAAVSAGRQSTAFRAYVEFLNGQIQTGLAIANVSDTPTSVVLELTRLDGTPTGLRANLTIPARGQTSFFVDQLAGLTTLASPFQGVLGIRSAHPVSVASLRGRVNERQDFLISATPPVEENAPLSSLPLYFPHIADSGGYTSQFILLSPGAGTSTTGTLQLFSQAGGPMSIALTD